jgi:P4 family phage/plasmid primase-like protien
MNERTKLEPTLEELKILAEEAEIHESRALTGEIIFQGVDEDGKELKPDKKATPKAQGPGLMQQLRNYGQLLHLEHQIVYIQETKQFYTYEKTHYVQRDPLFFGSLLEKSEHKTLSNEKNNKELLGVLKRLHGVSLQEFKDSTDGFINFQNGHYNKRTKEIIAHEQSPTGSRYFTYCLPFAYDPSAIAPQWEAFMVQCFNDRRSGTLDLESVTALHEFMGYTLSGDENWADKMLLAIGPSGANGKGTIWNVMRKLLGEDAYSALPAATIGTETGRFGLNGKLANLSAEEGVDAFVKNEAILKSLTSKDAVSARAYYSQQTKLANRAKLWFSCNEALTSHDMSGGWFRRLLVLQFNNKAVDAADFASESESYRHGFVYQKDIQLDKRLATELPGIFNIAMQAYELALKRGELLMPGASRKAVKEMADDDMIGEIIESVFVAGLDTVDKMSHEKIITAFNEAVAKRGLGVRVPQRKILASVRHAFMAEGIKSNGTRFLKGIRLKAEQPEMQF